MKGADMYNNYKRNKAMAAAMDTLIENDRRFHQRMLALEGDLGVVTQTVAMGFEQINSGFQTLNRKIVRTAAEMDLMLNLTEKQFKETHEVLNNHHLALYYLSKGITTLIPLMCKYISQGVGGAVRRVRLRHKANQPVLDSRRRCPPGVNNTGAILMELCAIY